MYKNIEKLYKKKSPSNRIKKKIFFVYITIVFFLFIFNLFHVYIMLLVIVYITFWIIKKICEKELNLKLNFISYRNNSKHVSLEKIICVKENEMFKKYLSDNKIYNFQTIKCIMEHYRNLVKPKSVSDNFWSITAIAISVALAFVTKEGFDFKSFENALPYLISFILIVVIITAAIKQLGEIKTFFKGEDGMFKKLESIFSELYIECVSEIGKEKIESLRIKKDTENNRTSSKNNKKRKKQKRK